MPDDITLDQLNQQYGPLVQQGNQAQAPAEPPAPSIDKLNADYGWAAHPAAVRGLAPLTSQALSQSGRNAPEVGTLSISDQYKRMNQQADETGKSIPLDVENGIPPWQYIKMAANRDNTSKFDYLRQQYGDQFVRPDNHGNPIVRLKDQAGNLKDVAVNPVNLNWRDLANTALGTGAELAGSIAVSALTDNPVPATTFIGRAIQGAMLAGKVAAGGEAAGAVKDAFVRGAEDIPINPGEIAKTRAENAALGTVTGAAGMPVIAGIKYLSAPFGGDLTAANTKAIAAADVLNHTLESYGTTKTLPLSPAEASGSTTLNRIESFIRPQPGAAGAYKAFDENRKAALQELQNNLLDLPPNMGTAGPASLGTQEQVGSGVARELGQTAQAEQDVTKGLKAGIGSSLRDQIENLAVPAGAAPDRALTASAVRDAIESKYQSDVVPLQKQYTAFLQRPDIVDADVSVPGFQSEIRNIKSELPKMTVDESKVGYDTYGSPMQVNQANQKVLPDFVPSNILNHLDQIASANNPRFQIADLIKMRRDVSDALATQQGMPNTGAHYLGDIREALTKAIKGGLDKISPAARADWESLNNAYAKTLGSFKQAGLDEIFEHTPGTLSPRIGDNELYQKFTSGPVANDRYTALSNLLGQHDPAMISLNHRMASEVIGNATPISGAVDVASLYKQLSDLQSKSPEMFKGMFGSGGGKLMEAVKLSGVNDGTIPREYAAAILNGSSNPTAFSISQVLAQQDAIASKYKNSILKAVRDHTLNPTAADINPSELMNSLFLKASKSETDEVMGYLAANPALEQEVRRQAMATLLSKANGQTFSADSIQKALGNSSQQAKWESLIGQDKMELLGHMRDFLGAGAANPAWKMAGGLKAGAIAGQLESSIAHASPEGLTSWAVGNAVRYALASVFLSPQMARWATSPGISAQTANRMTKAFLVSQPLWADLTGHFGIDASREAVNILAKTIDQRYPINQKTK